MCALLFAISYIAVVAGVIRAAMWVYDFASNCPPNPIYGGQ